MYLCKICAKSFTSSRSLKRHKINQHDNKRNNKFKCTECTSEFTSQNYLNRHLMILHAPSTTTIDYDNPQPSTSTAIATTKTSVKKSVKRKNETIDTTNNMQAKKSRRSEEATRHCDVCKIDIRKRAFTAHLKSNKHKTLSSVLYRSNNIEIINTAFKSRIQSFKVVNLNKKELIFSEFFKTIKESLITLIEEHIKVHTTVKVNIELFGLYELVKNDDIETDIKSFNTKSEIVDSSSDLSEILNTWFEVIKVKSEGFNEQNSGWSLLEILQTLINIFH